MSQMRLHIAVPLIALLFVPAPVHAEDPLAMAEAITEDTVRILVSVGVDGDDVVLPFCDPRDVEQGQSLIGYVRTDCFEALVIEEEVAPGPLCQLATVGVAPYRIPSPGAAGANPNEACVYTLVKTVLRLVPDPVQVVVATSPINLDQ